MEKIVEKVKNKTVEMNPLREMRPVREVGILPVSAFVPFPYLLIPIMVELHPAYRSHPSGYAASITIFLISAGKISRL